MGGVVRPANIFALYQGVSDSDSLQCTQRALNRPLFIFLKKGFAQAFARGDVCTGASRNPRTLRINQETGWPFNVARSVIPRLDIDYWFRGRSGGCKTSSRNADGWRHCLLNTQHFNFDSQPSTPNPQLLTPNPLLDSLNLNPLTPHP